MQPKISIIIPTYNEAENIVKLVGKMLKYYKISNKVFFHKCDAKKLLFNNKQFDAVIGISILEHLNNPEKAIKEVARVLKKDSEVILRFPKNSIINKVIFPILTVFGEHKKGKHKQTAEQPIEIIRNYFLIEEIKYLPAFLPKGLA